MRRGLVARLTLHPEEANPHRQDVGVIEAIPVGIGGEGELPLAVLLVRRSLRLVLDVDLDEEDILERDRHESLVARLLRSAFDGDRPELALAVQRRDPDDVTRLRQDAGTLGAEGRHRRRRRRGWRTDGARCDEEEAHHDDQCSRHGRASAGAYGGSALNQVRRACGAAATARMTSSVSPSGDSNRMLERM